MSRAASTVPQLVQRERPRIVAAGREALDHHTDETAERERHRGEKGEVNRRHDCHPAATGRAGSLRFFVVAMIRPLLIRYPPTSASARIPSYSLRLDRGASIMATTQTQTAAAGSRGLAGKSAIVTGSTSGIGLGIAQALAQAGADIMLNGFGDAKEIEKIRADLANEHKVKVVYDGSDMSKGDAVAGMVQNAEKTFGKVDIIVNNAGIQYVAPIDEFPVAKWDAILAINLSSAFHSTRAALPGMKQRKWGRIINIASAHGLVASPFKSAYVAAKHGMLGLTKTTALEVAELGITANAICPGYVWTPLVESQLDGQAKAHNMTREQVIHDVLLAQQPNKRFATVEEMGALAAFLCSDAAASITGTALPVDGGWTAH
jgi:3-hydroxybutyrate dehydrogenase